jgi:hypothetical protein
MSLSKGALSTIEMATEPVHILHLGVTMPKVEWCVLLAVLALLP